MSEKQPNEKFCYECGEIIRVSAEICPKCGINQGVLSEGATQKHCFECGEKIRAIAEICPKCGIRQELMPKSTHQKGSKSKITAGVLALLLGGFGAQHFYLGNPMWGLIYFCIIFVGGTITCSLLAWVMLVVNIIEGIKILSMTDDEFIQACENNQISILASFIKK